MEDGPCSEGVDYSGQFFKPKAGDVFRPGDKITAYWFGGKKGPDIQGLNFARTKRWSLTIQHLRFRQIATELGATKAVNMTIFSDREFIHATADWADGDACGNTQANYTWTVPADFDTAGEHEFVLVVRGDVAGTTAPRSDSFTVLDAVDSALGMTTSSASGGASSTSTGSASASPPAAQTVSDGGASDGAGRFVGGGLSGAAIVGIVVAFILVALAALGVFWFLRRRRRREQEAEGNVVGGAVGGHGKLELDGQEVELPKTGVMLDGAAVSELDNGNPRKGHVMSELEDEQWLVEMQSAAQPPVELDAVEQVVSRHSNDHTA